MKIVSKTATAVLLSICPVVGFAASVELSSPDGLVSVVGELKDFDGKMLTVDTSYGIVKIPASEVVCSGACPDGVAQLISETNVTVAINSEKDRELLFGFLRDEGFAEQANAVVEIEANEAATITTANQTASLQLLSQSEGDIKISIGSRTLSAGNTIPLTSTDDARAQAFEVAVNTLAVIMGPDTGLDAVSHEDLSRIYAGEVTNWSDIGGNDVVIQPILVNDAEQGLGALSAAVLEPFGKSAGSNTLNVKTDEQAVQIVSMARGSVGVVDIQAVPFDQVTPIRTVCDAQILPSEFSVNTGEYPLSVSTFAALDEAIQSPVLPRVFDAMASRDTQSILRNAGYQTQSIIYASEDAKGSRVQSVVAKDWQEPLLSSARDLVLMLLDAKQLSVRFQSGLETQAIAARTRADFVRLAEAMERGEFDGQEILFVGFADGSDPNASIKASQESANSVLRAFERFAPEAARRQGIALRASGHGNVGIACSANETRDAANVVEIWVRPVS